MFRSTQVKKDPSFGSVRDFASWFPVFSLQLSVAVVLTFEVLFRSQLRAILVGRVPVLGASRRSKGNLFSLRICVSYYFVLCDQHIERVVPSLFWPVLHIPRQCQNHRQLKKRKTTRPNLSSSSLLEIPQQNVGCHLLTLYACVL